MNCFMGSPTADMTFMMHVEGTEMPPVIGCVAVPSALSDNYGHSLKKIVQLLLRKLVVIFVSNFCELLDKPIIWFTVKWMGEI